MANEVCSEQHRELLESSMHYMVRQEVVGEQFELLVEPIIVEFLKGIDNIFEIIESKQI